MPSESRLPLSATHEPLYTIPGSVSSTMIHSDIVRTKTEISQWADGSDRLGKDSGWRNVVR